MLEAAPRRRYLLSSGSLSVSQAASLTRLGEAVVGHGPDGGDEDRGDDGRKTRRLDLAAGAGPMSPARRRGRRRRRRRGRGSSRSSRGCGRARRRCRWPSAPCRAPSRARRGWRRSGRARGVAAAARRPRAPADAFSGFRTPSTRARSASSATASAWRRSAARRSPSGRARSRSAARASGAADRTSTSICFSRSRAVRTRSFSCRTALGPVGGVGRREQRAEPRLGVGQHRLQLGLVLLEHGCTPRRDASSRLDSMSGPRTKTRRDHYLAERH